MAKKKKEPDKLSQDAAAARAAGMSYGKWKGLQEPVKTERKKKIPEDWKICEYCGKPYKPTTRRPQKYCEPNCANNAYWERERQKKALPIGKCT